LSIVELKALFVLLAAFLLGFVIGEARGARKRRDGLEKRIEALEVSAGLRKAE
jgi:uncharacterized membrane protein YhiD involved in acid resistance